VDGKPFERELGPELQKASKDADAILDEVGKSWGNRLADSTSTEIGKHGKDFGHSIEDAVEKTTVRLHPNIDFKRDRNGRLHDAAGKFVREFEEDVVSSFQNLTRGGGPFSKIGEGIADAIGAGANVSGKSPLIAVLVPAFGALGAAIAAVVQIANALVAVLTTLPALITAIGLQAGVLMLAFKGVGTAIQGAFAAKNWTDFYAAIQGLTPAAQRFVISLLPLRDLFRELKTSVQESFFTAFGNTMVNLVQELGPILRSGLPQLATALGGLFKQIGLFFASPVFVTFVRDVIPATVRWLGQFGPGFVGLLTSLINMAHTAIPFLERVGQIVTNAFMTFSNWLNDQVKSGDLLGWLNEMGDTLDKTSELFFNIIRFVGSLVDALNKAGGNDVIDQLSELFNRLAIFFSSPEGQAAMAGFIHSLELLTYIFSGLVFTFTGSMIAIESVIQFFAFLGTAIGAFVSWLTDTAGPAIATFFTETFPGWISSLATSVSNWFGKISYYIQSGFGAAIEWVMTKWNEFTGWIGRKVADVTSFFTGLPGRLADIGRSMMQGLKDGLQWGWDHTVGPILKWITSQVPSWKGPESKDRVLLEPAGQAVMEGFGQGLTKGAQNLRTMLAGFTDSLGGVGISGSGGGGVSPIVVNVGFHGSLPTEQQAYDTGRAAGRGVNDEMASQVNQRNIRLAVRMA